MNQKIPLSQKQVDPKPHVPIHLIEDGKISALGYLNRLFIPQIKGVDEKGAQTYLGTIALTVRKIWRTHSTLLFVGHEIDRGTSKTVYNAYELYENDGRIKKIAFHTTSKTEAFRKEYELLRSIPEHCQVVDAPNIIFEIPSKCIGATQTLYDCDGFDLAEGEYPLAQRLSVADDILLGLHQLHNLGIIHRDIKPENMLIRFERVKGELWPIAYIGDLGFARKAKEVKHLAGSLVYLAPEVAKTMTMTQKTDIWACGITTYAMLTRGFPYNINLVEDYGFKKGLPMIRQEKIDYNIGLHAIVYGKRWLSHLQNMLSVVPETRKLPKIQKSK